MEVIQLLRRLIIVSKLFYICIFFQGPGNFCSRKKQQKMMYLYYQLCFYSQQHGHSLLTTLIKHSNYNVNGNNIHYAYTIIKHANIWIHKRSVNYMVYTLVLYRFQNTDDFQHFSWILELFHQNWEKIEDLCNWEVNL